MRQRILPFGDKPRLGTPMDPQQFDALRVLGLGVIFLLVVIAESIRPHALMQRPWQTNLGLWLVDTTLTRLVCGACGLVVAAWAVGAGFGALQLFDAPLWVALLISVVALDLVSCLWHWVNHHVPWLWRLHRVHHADRAFQVTTALRFHPGELLLSLPVRLSAIALIGIPVEGVLLFEIVFGAMNLVVHANFSMPEWLDRTASRVLVTPSMHRLHHAQSSTLVNRNFGTIFSVFDRGLGTIARLPAAAQFGTGVVDTDGDQQMSLLMALKSPFIPRVV